MGYVTVSGERFAADADLDGDGVRRAEPDVVRCWLCLSPAGWTGWDGDPDDPDTGRIPVCGSHMTDGDERH